MSKAFDRSTKSAAQCFLLSEEEIISFVTNVTAEIVLCLALKPD